jgi:glycosyltransferase involved in cell wall biosynthesis
MIEKNLIPELFLKILYINHYAGSLKHGMEFRPFYMSREWVRSGHQVTILAASHSHVRATQPQMTKTFSNEIIEGVNYIWAKTPTYHKNGVKRFFNMLCFIARVFQYSLSFKSSDTPDAVIASSTYPLDIFPAWFIAKRYKAKLLFEVHDLWPLSPIELGGMKRSHPFIVLMQFAENFAYKNSDKVISMLPKTLEYMKEHGLNPNKFVYIPNGIDLEEWKNPVKLEDYPFVKNVEQEILADQSQGFFTVAYLGTHGLANALDNLICAAEILKNENVMVYLVGSGPDKNALIELARSKNLSNVKFINPIPKQTIPLVTKLFDCNYIGLQKQSLFRFGISPNKLMDYMAAEKPIINAVEAGNDPVAEAKCGYSIPAENPKALAEAILKLKNLPKNELNYLGKNGYEFMKSEHDYKILANKFLNVMVSHE